MFIKIFLKLHVEMLLVTCNLPKGKTYKVTKLFRFLFLELILP